MTLSFTASSYRAEVYEQLANAEVTDKTSNVAGEVIDLANFKGTSAFKATTGVASMAVGTLAELKEGFYMGVVTAATKVKIYGFGDQSFADGTLIQFVDDTYMIGSEITIVASTPAACTALGITLTGGSGTIGMTVGDSFTFYIRRGSVVGEEILITGDTDFANIGVMLFPDKYNDEYTVIDCFNFLAAGLGLDIKDTWSSYTISADLIKDETEGGYYKIYRNRPA